MEQMGTVRNSQTKMKQYTLRRELILFSCNKWLSSHFRSPPVGLFWDLFLFELNSGSKLLLVSNTKKNLGTKTSLKCLSQGNFSILSGIRDLQINKMRC